MKHIHKRFAIEQVKILFAAYLKNRVARSEVEEELGIGKTRFFALWNYSGELNQNLLI